MVHQLLCVHRSHTVLLLASLCQYREYLNTVEPCPSVVSMTCAIKPNRKAELIQTTTQSPYHTLVIHSRGRGHTHMHIHKQFLESKETIVHLCKSSLDGNRHSCKHAYILLTQTCILWGIGT